MSFDPRNLALVSILVGAALITGVIARVGDQPQASGAGAPPTPRGHYMLGAVLHGADDEGRFYYELIAERVEQSAVGEGIELEGICVEYRPEHDVRWDICADNGFTDADSLKLENNVRMVYESQPGEDEVSFETDELVIDTGGFYAATDQLVTMRRNSAIVTAKGLALDLNTDDWRLGSKNEDDGNVTIRKSR